MPGAKMKIEHESETDETGKPLVTEIIATSFPRWKELGWREHVPQDADSSVKQPVAPVGEGEPSAEAQKANAEATAKASEGGATPEEAAAAGAQAEADVTAQEKAAQADGQTPPAGGDKVDHTADQKDADESAGVRRQGVKPTP